MPSILSKSLRDSILGSEWSFGYNCYEVGHCWTPSCTDAALEVSLAACLNILPLYALLYIFSQVAVQRKYDVAASWETLKSTLRSSFFIFFHAYNGSLMGCALRRGFGRFYYRVLVCAPALLSSCFSLLIEKPSRRQTLAFYLLNLASEIVYRMLVTKGQLRPLAHGETLLFAISLSAWYYFIKMHGFGHDPVSAAAKLLIGRGEAKSRAAAANKALDSHGREAAQQEEVPETGSPELASNSPLSSDYSASGKLRRHATCGHLDHSSCLSYVLGPIPSRIAAGHLIQALLSVSRSPMKLIERPYETLWHSFTSKSSLRFGLFLATLVSVGRATSCSLRHYFGAERPWHAAASGFAAGLSMLWAPRSSLSMYIMWKAVEQYYLQAAKSGRAKYFDLTILSIYSVSAATVLYTFALEPQLMRPSYMKFLDNLSDHRLHQLNRMVLDVFGTGASKGYEDYFPDLDPKHMSKQFKELIFNWMIQPYD